MKMIYVCSPYRGDVAANVRRARTICREVLRADMIPIAPHLYFTQFLNDDVKEEREVGCEAGLDMLELCDAVWVFRTAGLECTEGMQAEIRHAKKSGIPVKYIE